MSGIANSISAYQVEYSNNYNCMFLNDFIDISTSLTYKKPAVVLQISKYVVVHYNNCLADNNKLTIN